MSLIKTVIRLPGRIILTFGFILVYVIMLPGIKNRTELHIMTNNLVELIKSGKAL